MLNISSVKDVTVVKFGKNKINILVSEALKIEFVELLEVSGVKLLIDMVGVDFVDSSGFTVFLTALRIAQKNNGQIVFCNLSDPALELFKVLQLHTVFKIADNQEEAITLFE